jgi:hydrogenase maturation protease
VTWSELERRAPQRAEVGGAVLRRGSRVRLAPRPGGDVLDAALAGQAAIVEAIEEDVDGRLHVAVVVEGDPGRDLGAARMPGHRFFFPLDEVEPLLGAPPTRVLVAGIGNVFLGDDGFGSALARRLAERALPAGVTVRDFGIRGMDLAYALGEDWDAALLLDAVPGGEPPGTLSIIEPELDDDDAVELDTHGMHPVKVLRLARELGPLPGRTLVVGCEPQTRPRPDDEDMAMELSAPVSEAVARAIELVETLLEDIIDDEERRR